MVEKENEREGEPGCNYSQKMGCGVFEHLNMAHTAVTVLTNFCRFIIFQGGPCEWHRGKLFVAVVKGERDCSSAIDVS